MWNKICNLRCLPVSATGHPQLKKNACQKESKNESTLTNITKVPMWFLAWYCT